MEAPRPAWNDDAAKFYDLYRRYIEHEDELINHRFMWMVTINAFLITTWGFCVQKYVEVAWRTAEAFKPSAAALTSLFELRLFVLALSFLGLAVSWFSYRHIGAAIRSIEALEKRGGKAAHAEGFPPLTGGGAKGAHKRGTSLTHHFPATLTVFWFAVSGYMTFVFVRELGITLETIKRLLSVLS